MGNVALIALVAIISSAPPIATDLFLPALPDLPSYFHVSESQVNIILIAFFLFMAVGMLVIGPMSDRYGRKKPLLLSLGLFISCAVGCSLCTNIIPLIVLRVLQGFGGGGMVALGTALVKDCFSGEMRQRILVIVMAIGVIAPMGAPVLGAVILSFTTWQGTFVAQALIGLAALPLALILKEPLAVEDRVTVSTAKTLSGLVSVGRNKGFMLLLLSCAIYGSTFMAYVANASYIYIDFFGLSKLGYSLFFAANAAFTALGAWLVVLVGKRVFPRFSLGIAMVAALASGILVFTVGRIAPWSFFLCFVIFTLAAGFNRPLSTEILLIQQSKDTGSASSLINTVHTVCGSLAMVAVSLPWGGYVEGLGICLIIASALSLMLYLILMKSSISVRGL